MTGAGYTGTSDGVGVLAASFTDYFVGAQQDGLGNRQADFAVLRFTLSSNLVGN